MKLRKNKRRTNIAPPTVAPKREPEFTPEQIMVATIAVRESRLDLLNSIIALLTSLRAEVTVYV